MPRRACFFSLNTPALTGRTKIILNGTGFGSIKGKVLFDTIEVPVANADWQETKISVTVPNLPVGSTTVFVRVADMETREPFTVSPGPQIHTPQPSAAAAKATIVLPGTAFGSSSGKLTLSGTDVPVPAANWTDSQITFVVPDGAKTGNLIVTTTDNAVSPPAYFTVVGSKVPQIASLSVLSASPTDTVTIFGQNFGAKPGKVNIGNADATPEAGHWNDTSIQIKIPSEAKPGPVTVQTSEGISNGQVLQVIGKSDPVIETVTPTSALPGASVVLKGSNFGTARGTVTLHGESQNISAWTDTSITFTLTDSAKAGDLEVVTNGQQVAFAPPFDVLAEHWGDEDERPLDISVVGGYEQGYQSAEAANSDPFIALYGRRLFTIGEREVGPYFSIRLLQAPVAGNTYNVFSVINSPTQTLTATSLQQVGSAVDVTMGLEYHPTRFTTPRGQTTVDFIGGGGFISPTQANSQQAAFAMPDFVTQECSELKTRITQSAPTFNQNQQYVWETSGKYCLGNKAIQVPVSGSSTTTDTGVTTLIYGTPDSRNFYGKWEAGIRVINRYYSTSDQSSCSTKISCVRGIADFTVGQNASITGGTLKHLVFTAEAIHPVPVKSLTFIYFFGAIMKRVGDSGPNYGPLILQPASISTTNQPPSPVTMVLPATQPDRDFYRFGAGVSLDQIFTAFKNK